MKMTFHTIKAVLFQSSHLIRRIPRPFASRLISVDIKQQKQALSKEKKLAARAPIPEYIKKRSTLWVDLKAKHDDDMVLKEPQQLKIKLTDGKIVEGSAWETTPLDVAKGISSSLASEVYVAKVNDELWDLERPLTVDCQVELLKFNASDAKAVFWVTTAYSLAEALERLYCLNEGRLGNIGFTEAGFFADVHLKDRTLSLSDKAIIEEEMRNVLSVRGKIERIEVSKSDLLELFSYNSFKLRTINESQEDVLPLYRCGNYIDVCRSPLMRHNKKVKAFKVLKIESVSNKQDAGSVQRIHGISFPSDGELQNFLKTKKI